MHYTCLHYALCRARGGACSAAGWERGGPEGVAVVTFLVSWFLTLFWTSIWLFD